MSTKEVLTAVAGGVMTITMNRPESKNAINRNAAGLIAQAMDDLDADPEIRAGILTGANNTFCSGMDLKAFLRGESPVVEGRGFAGLCEGPPKKPLIAAVEGYALAGGFEIAIACDLIVAAENAILGIPETKLGLVAGAGGLVRLCRQISPRIAMELALTGEFISAQRAFAIGLINCIVPIGGALEAAQAMARKIAANGPLAIIASKRVIGESQDWLAAEMFEKQGPLIRAIFSSEDAIEGARAFAEKRTPNWNCR
jgi:enoyl-CoA hydratase